MATKFGITFRLSLMMFLVSAYFFVELIIGYKIHSLALMADAFHMLSDFLALGVGLTATRISKWPRSSKNTFGWQRAEIIGALINCVILLTLCTTIFMDAIQRMIIAEKIEDPEEMVYVGIGGLVINILGLLLFGVHSHGDTHDIPVEQVILEEYVNHKGSQDMLYLNDTTDHLPSSSVATIGSNVTHESVTVNIPETSVRRSVRRSGKKEEVPRRKGKLASMNIRGVFLHILADFFGSVIVVVSAIILWKVPDNAEDPSKNVWKMYIDPCMSMLMVFLIFMSTIPLLRKTTLILLQSVPNEVCIVDLKERLEMIEGVIKIHHLHVWRLQSNCNIGTVHVRCDSLRDYLRILRDVKQRFHEANIQCITIQPEFEEPSDEQALLPIDYQACVLDCGSNKTCQSDACCPAATNGTQSAEDILVPPIVSVGQSSSVRTTSIPESMFTVQNSSNHFNAKA